jgi:hypothetical protein
MNSKKTFPRWALITMVVVVVACVPIATTEVTPTTPYTGSVSSTPEPTVTAVATTEVKPTVMTAPPTGSASATPEPTATTAPASAEIDCMGACHEIDINELLGAGAKPQPASHKGRTTCLACHATLAKPALPTTHLGRLDAACSGCHLPK